LTVAMALEVRASCWRTDSTGEVSYLIESALFEVLVFTLNEPPVNFEEVRLIVESMRPLLVVTANSVAFPEGSLRRPTSVEMKELEVWSLSEVDVLKEPVIGQFEVVKFASWAKRDLTTMG